MALRIDGFVDFLGLRRVPGRRQRTEPENYCDAECRGGLHVIVREEGGPIL
jgi:hypothetical protein